MREKSLKAAIRDGIADLIIWTILTAICLAMFAGKPSPYQQERIDKRKAFCEEISQKFPSLEWDEEAKGCIDTITRQQVKWQREIPERWQTNGQWRR